MKAYYKLISTLAQKYKTPYQVQNYLKSFNYNNRPTLQSAYSAIKSNFIHCFEGVFVAAAILECHNYEPLVLSFESQDGLDHTLFIFKENNRWGAVGRSRDKGLHGRRPIFRNLRELTWSYFDPYVDFSGRILGHAWCHLDETLAPWRTSEKGVWKAEKYLFSLEHTDLNSSDVRYQKLLKHYKEFGGHPAKDYWW